MATKGKWKICPECEGEGTVLMDALQNQSFSTEDFNNDPDFAEGYFGGDYDVTCTHCQGAGKIKTA